MCVCACENLVIFTIIAYRFSICLKKKRDFECFDCVCYCGVCMCRKWGKNVKRMRKSRSYTWKKKIYTKSAKRRKTNREVETEERKKNRVACVSKQGKSKHIGSESRSSEVFKAVVVDVASLRPTTVWRSSIRPRATFSASLS